MLWSPVVSWALLVSMSMNHEPKTKKIRKIGQKLSKPVHKMNQKLSKPARKLNQRWIKYAKGGSQITEEEQILFFPTAAHQVNATHWSIPIHGWILEPQDESRKRKAFLSVLSKLLHISPQDIATQSVLNRRVRPFLSRNSDGKRPRVVLGRSPVSSSSSNNGTTTDESDNEMESPNELTREPILFHDMPRSLKNGHFKDNVMLSKKELDQYINRISISSSFSSHHRLQEAEDQQSSTSSSATDKNHMVLPYYTIGYNDRIFSGVSHVVPSTGISIISDIDDTIKITESYDKNALLRNTFLKELTSVPGMAEFYQKLQNHMPNCSFHYVSASPYQLFSEMQSFFSAQEFPPATYHLKTVRPKDHTILELFADPISYKRMHITRILQQFPARRVYLVGDSGEKDPEVYAAIYRQFPQQVSGIWIRNVTVGSSTQSETTNLQERMLGVPMDKIQLFYNGYDLMQEVLPEKKRWSVGYYTENHSLE